MQKSHHKVQDEVERAWVQRAKELQGWGEEQREARRKKKSWNSLDAIDLEAPLIPLAFSLSLVVLTIFESECEK